MASPGGLAEVEGEVAETAFLAMHGAPLSAKLQSVLAKGMSDAWVGPKLGGRDANGQ